MILLGICFYTKTELAEKNEYERVAYPHTIQEMITINEEEKKAKLERRKQREEQIAINVAKLEQWKNDLINRKNIKEEAGKLNKIVSKVFVNNIFCSSCGKGT